MGNPTILSNHSSIAYGPGIRGVFNQRVPVNMGWVSISGKAGDVAFIQLSSLVIGDINQGVFYQSEVAATAEYTLCNPGLTQDMSPEAQAAVLWTDSQDIAANQMVKADWSVFTSVKITLQGDGTLYIGVR